MKEYFSYLKVNGIFCNNGLIYGYCRLFTNRMYTNLLHRSYCHIAGVRIVF